MQNLLLQTTIESDPDDWHIGRFGLLAEYLAGLRDESGQPAFRVIARNRDARGSPDAVVRCHACDRQPSAPRAPAQDPDSDAPLLTARCLQDARTLLDSIALPPPRKGVSG